MLRSCIGLCCNQGKKRSRGVMLGVNLKEIDIPRCHALIELSYTKEFFKQKLFEFLKESQVNREVLTEFVTAFMYYMKDENILSRICCIIAFSYFTFRLHKIGNFNLNSSKVINFFTSNFSRPELVSTEKSLEASFNWWIAQKFKA